MHKRFDSTKLTLNSSTGILSFRTAKSLQSLYEVTRQPGLRHYCFVAVDYARGFFKSAYKFYTAEKELSGLRLIVIHQSFNDCDVSYWTSTRAPRVWIEHRFTLYSIENGCTNLCIQPIRRRIASEARHSYNS